MSTDLKFRQGWPEPRLPTIRIKSADPSDTSTATIDQTPKSGRGCGGGDGEEYYSETPTTPEHRLIPPMKSCPPAPKKPRRAVACKRKLREQLEFFEIVAREEVESFFRASSLKRRCRPPCSGPLMHI